MEKKKNTPKLRFPEFTGEWEEKKLGEICDIKGGKRIPKGFSLQSDKNGYPYITVSDMKGGTVLLDNLQYVPLEVVNQIKNYKVSVSDIYISVAGTLGLVGIIPDELDNANLTENANKLTNIKCDQKFLYQFLTGDQLKNLIESVKTIGAQPKLAIYALNDFVILLPRLSEQTKIATFLTAVDEKLTQLKKKKTLLEQYKKGVMQKLFSQELRFKDDNNQDFPDWQEKTLGEVGDIVTGKTPSTTNIDLWNGEIQFVTPTDINDDKYQFSTQRTIKALSKTKVLPIKSIMFTCIASIGKISLSIKPCITNQQINSIIPYKEFDNEFIYYSLLNIVDYIRSTQSSNTLPIINKTDFSKFVIQVPSLPEQQKIANFLSSIDEKISQCSAQIEKMEAWKKGLLQQMFC